MVSFSGTVTGNVTLGSGTAAIGKLTSNSGVDIGDVSVDSLPASTVAGASSLPTGTNTIGAVTVAGSASAATALTENQVSVTTSATQIIAANANRRSLIIENSSGSSVFIADTNGVTTSNGFKMASPSAISFNRVDDGYTGAVFGIVASGSATVTYLEV